MTSLFFRSGVSRHRLALAGLIGLFWCGVAFAQAPAGSSPGTPGTGAAQELTPEWVKAKIEQLTTEADGQAGDGDPQSQKNSGKLGGLLGTGKPAGGPADADPAVELYRSALDQLEAARASSAMAATFQEAIATAPKTAATLRRQLASLDSTGKPAVAEPAADAPLAEIEAYLDGLQAEAATLRNALNRLEASLQAQAERPAAARQELTVQQKALASLTGAPPQASGSGETGLAEAKRVLQTARHLAISAQINSLDQELISLPVRQEALAAERDLVKARLAILDRRITEVQARTGQRRQLEAEQQQAEAEQIERQLSGRHPLLAEYAQQTAALSQKLTDVTQLIDQTLPMLASTKTAIRQLDISRQTADQILEIGAGEGFGQLLRELRAKLPATAKIRQRIAKREQVIIDARLQRLRLDERLRPLNETGTEIDSLLDEWAARDPAGPQPTAETRATLAELAASRRTILAGLAEAYAKYIDLLAELNTLERELALKAGQLALTLDERMLWLSNTGPTGLAWIGQIPAGALWLLNPDGWRTAAVELAGRLGDMAPASLVVFLLFTALLALGPLLRRRLALIETSVGRVNTDNYLLTPRALLITVLLAVPWPLLLSYTGWLLTRGRNEVSFAVALGFGLLSVGYIVAVLRFFRLMCRDHGLFGAHFDWSDQARRTLGRNLGWLMVIAAPSALIVSMTLNSNNEVYRDGIGRLAFIVGSLALTVATYRILRPRKGAFSDLLSRDGPAWRGRLQLLPLVAAAPAILGGLAAYGYYHAAVLFQSRLFMTGWVLLLGLTVYQFAMRSVVVAHRRLAVRRAHQMREKAQAAEAARQAVDASGEAVPQTLEMPEIDLASVSLQTRTLLRAVVGAGVFVGLWLVWSEIVPALGVLDEIPLWTRTAVTDQGSQTLPVTVWDLLTAALVAAITVLAARNLPGSLEITVVQRLSLDAGTRYAIATISRYVIVTVGLLVALDRIGADWSQMQWIVAALGVGLGFGLQEIVANFVSGLIILFERPVRVGDTVTVGDLSGTVSRIQIRATTITDWDNREILVPNKSFITDRVVNWTLTDPITRLVLNVGIAYGSDTALAHRLMLETAKANPLVLESPAPAVFLLGFGDSSLDFEVRVFVRDLLHRMPVMHELHMAIDQTLRAHDIEIPFPQRDLHLRSSEAPITIAGMPGEPRREKNEADGG